MKKKGFLLVMVSTSALRVYYGADFVSRVYLTKNEHSETVTQRYNDLVNSTYSTKHSNGETFARMTTRPPNVTALWNRFPQIINENTKNFYFKSWDNMNGVNVILHLHPFLLVFVLSLPANTNERQTIRGTWGNFASQNTSSFNIYARLVFMLGRMTDGITLDRLVQNESTEYKDIIQFDFFESRYNLTSKMMHVDDDSFVNVARLSNYVLADSNINNTNIHGYVYRNGGPVLREGKYAVTKEELPSSYYPPYVSGTSYILPYDAIPDMLDLAERLPYCPVDDAFKTGVMRAILGIQLNHCGFHSYVGDKNRPMCIPLKTCCDKHQHRLYERVVELDSIG
ncbi:hypothetical protein ACJMK2_021765 [Sinanodonta woodiana]|uniref:Hexosyltransferase n=1 Tax=Sinanodonta woodiana TaxID=1069815 RepID=A0ABD3TJ16_SINWO